MEVERTERSISRIFSPQPIYRDYFRVHALIHKQLRLQRSSNASRYIMHRWKCRTYNACRQVREKFSVNPPRTELISFVERWGGTVKNRKNDKRPNLTSKREMTLVLVVSTIHANLSTASFFRRNMRPRVFPFSCDLAKLLQPRVPVMGIYFQLRDSSRPGNTKMNAAIVK